MRKMLLIGVCLLGANATCAQSTQDAFGEFRDSVVKKQFVLRNFSDELKVRAVWTGTTIGLDTPRWYTFGLLEVNSVKMKGPQITLDCNRRVLVWNQQHSLAPYAIVDPVQISVDLRDGNAAQILPQLRDQLFYSSTADALDAIPKLLRKQIPSHIPGTLNAVQPRPLSCDCGEKETDSCVGNMKAAGIVPPKIVHAPDPEFSEEARRKKLNGHVITAFVVDESGHTSDVWIAQPLGEGLDQKAAEAVLGYVFQPATCNGRPVGTPLGSEINFRIF